MRSWLFWSALLVATQAGAQEFHVCGEIDDGARDYRGMTRTERRHIEGAHFTRDVERLRRGKTGALGGDIDYTLRHMPNNPSALDAMSRLGAKLKTERVPGATYPVGCYFERAVRFAPDDSMVRFVFGQYLLRKGERAAARSQFDAAAQDAGASARLHYNLGLVFLDLGDVETALHHARLAYAGGPQPEGLARRLRELGRWGE